MATIISIDPIKSKRTGQIPFIISGTDLITSDLSGPFPGVFYVEETENGGETTEDNGLDLFISDEAGSLAGINTLHSFQRSFDVAFSFDHDLTTFPSVNGAKVACIRSYDILNSQTYGEIYLGYSDQSGYFLRVEGSADGFIIYNKTISIDPHQVSELRLIRSENRTTGYLKIEDTLIEVGSFFSPAITENKIKIYAKNSDTQVSGSFHLKLLDYKVETVVSLCDVAAEVSSVSDTEIKGRTRENEMGMGNLVIGFPDASYLELVNAFEYTDIQGANRDDKNFDITISVYNLYIKPSRNELFSSNGSFQWDSNYWVKSEKENKNLYIPSLWDPTTANVASESLQSGYGDGKNIQLIDIKKFRAESLESWHARVNHGTFFVKNVPYYLHSSESIVMQLGTDTTVDGHSYRNLKYLPKVGVPIIASTLTTDIETGLIIDKTRFEKRGSFTGIVRNGVELDTDVSTNIDKTKSEFIVHYNSNNIVKNWQIPSEGSSSGVFSFMLPSLPLRDFSVIFSRTDIFDNERESGSRYGEAGTIYNEVFYGEPLENIGDYSVNYITGEVNVIIDQEYFDLGYVTYTFDYPAKIEFNDNYLFNKGGDIESPLSSNLTSMDVIGESDGTEGQVYRLAEFPILDFSTSLNLDTESFSLFLYDESDNSFDASWERVRDITIYGPTSKVYQLSSDQGAIFFGNGISGMIPQKYKKIVGGYKTTVRIEYEPVSSSDYWIGRDTDLNLSRNSLNSGFLYLSRKELVPDTISIRFSTDEINALEFAELSAVVRDRDGDPVPGAELEFEVINGNGSLEEEVLITNSDGIAKTTFLPSGSIESLGTFAYLFEEGPTADILGDKNASAYFSSGTVLNNLLVADIEIDDNPEDVYVFKVYDNNDLFLPYDNKERTGGMHQVYYKENDPTITGDNVLIKPTAINGKVLIFEDSLPQPYTSSEPKYEPSLRGFAIIGKKRIQAKAKVDVGMFTIDSDIATLKVEYSPIQKGEWTLPTPPTEYDKSEISRATYITIDPEQSPNP